MSRSSAALDPVSLSALLASRLCHDLINPVGALGSGLDVLDDSSMDAGMKDAAIDLIRSGGEKSIALLKYARMAYGAAGGHGAQIQVEEAEFILRDLYKWAKAALEWRLAPGLMAKNRVKTILILAHAAADCAPRGGVVSVSGANGDFLIEARGPRLILQDDLVAALQGETDDIKPKFAPAYLAGLMARESGGGVEAALTDDSVRFSARFGAVGAAALTTG
jgi:histidine phosphotransferase ChpT